MLPIGALNQPFCQFRLRHWKLGGPDRPQANFCVSHRYHTDARQLPLKVAGSGCRSIIDFIALQKFDQQDNQPLEQQQVNQTAKRVRHHHPGRPEDRQRHENTHDAAVREKFVAMAMGSHVPIQRFRKNYRREIGRGTCCSIAP